MRRAGISRNCVHWIRLDVGRSNAADRARGRKGSHHQPEPAQTLVAAGQGQQKPARTSKAEPWRAKRAPIVTPKPTRRSPQPEPQSVGVGGFTDRGCYCPDLGEHRESNVPFWHAFDMTTRHASPIRVRSPDTLRRPDTFDAEYVALIQFHADALVALGRHLPMP